MADTGAARALLILGVLALASGCGPDRVKDGAPAARGAPGKLPGDAVPRKEPRSRYGNGPVYEVFGKRYTVLDSSVGYRERGVASWYGRKFHGRLTANREPYDMYAMTAAHKSLPLPTYVRVRNLQNDKSVVVRVNDRGPFIDNRIIDLSYSAALKLDMIRDGTSLVEVEAINFDVPRGDRPTRQLAAPPQLQDSSPQPDAASSEVRATDAGTVHTVYAQIGAYAERSNAERQFGLLLESGIRNALIYEDRSLQPALYRVRVGPITNAVQYDVLVEELRTLGMGEPYLVTN